MQLYKLLLSLYVKKHTLHFPFFRYDKNGLAIKMNSFNSQKQKINPLQFKIQKTGAPKGLEIRWGQSLKLTRSLGYFGSNEIMKVKVGNPVKISWENYPFVAML